MFKTGRAGSCDLSLIEGKSKAGTNICSSKISNWSKNYQDVRIINESASGIFRSTSENILEWL